MRYPLIVAPLIAFLIGCAPPNAQPGSPAAAPPATAAPVMGPTDVWSQAEVEAFLKEEFQFTTIAMTSTGGHNYEGTGIDPGGLNYTFTFKQVPGGYKLDWGTESGNGTITFGKPVP